MSAPRRGTQHRGRGDVARGAAWMFVAEVGLVAAAGVAAVVVAAVVASIF